MKSLKKTLVLLVVLSMILSTFVPAFAATDVADLDCEDAVLRMEALGIIEGFDDGTFRPTETITRAQMAVIICKMTGITKAAADASMNVPSKFSDVKVGEWYTGYINIAAGNGIISGFPDGTFRPNDVLTLNQVLTLCVKALGRGGYVDKMGTWPANYVTEAARLNLLKDVKGASSANRGNVAIIAWNTLNTATWYVNSENLDGEITLSDGANAKTLLAINYSEFATERDGAFKEITGLEIDADMIADSDTQLYLSFDLIETDDGINFANEFAKEPTRNKDEKSFKEKDDDNVYIYVPEEICEDLDELVGKSITLILGRDNVAALVIVEEDIQGNDFVTAYEATTATKEKITIAGTKYTMADTYKVKLNDKAVAKRDAVPEVAGRLTAIADRVTCPVCGKTGVTDGSVKHDRTCTADGYQAEVTAATALVNALVLAGAEEDDLKNIEKAIEATVILNSDDDVKSIDLKTSATIPGYSVETVVEKVRESSSTYKITTKAGDISWSLDDEDDDDIEFPKVYIDGIKGTMRDIKAGNVLTIYTAADSIANVEALSKIYVSTKSAPGKPERITKSENAIKVDGTYYSPSFTVADGAETGVDGTVIVTTEALKEGEWEEFNSKNILKNDEVTLYLNIYGEYVAISLEEVDSNYTFGIVTYVATTMTTSGDEQEYQEAQFRVLLEDGSKKYFTVSLDTSDEDLMDELDPTITEVLDVFDDLEKGDFVMFEANSDNKVVVEDENAIIRLVDKTGTAVSANTSTGVLEGDFIFGTTAALDDGEFDLTYGGETLNDVEYDANATVIFNLEEKEIVSKWKAILNDDEDEFKEPAKTYIIFKDKEADVAKYIVTCCDYNASDAIYAIGGAEEVYQDQKDENKYYASLDGMGELEFTTTATRDVKEGWLVEYAMSSTKLSDTFSIINVKDIFSKDTKYDVNTVAQMVDFATRNSKTPETKLLGLTGAEKLETIQLKEIAVKSNDDYKLKFVKNDDSADDVSNIDVDEKVKVYELSYNDKTEIASVEEIDIEDLKDRVEDAAEDIYAIPCEVGTTNPDHVIFVFAN